MSTNYTSNFHLCQWEAGDPVLRVDFNADNAKLDAALTAQQSAIARAQSAADNAFRPGYVPVVTGYYAGNDAASRDITLGFRPKAVLVLESHLFTSDNAAYYSAMVIDGMPLWSQCPLSITNTGFRVFRDVSVSGRKGTNMKEYNYLYMAIR